MIHPTWKKYRLTDHPERGRTHLTVLWNGSYRVSLCGCEGTVGQEWQTATDTYCKRCVRLARLRKNPVFKAALREVGLLTAA